MKKSVTSRTRVTRGGKVMVRKMGQCHFRAKKTGKQLLRKSRMYNMQKAIAKKINRKQGEF